MSERWRPDWRNPAAYPERLPRRQWRWEFLRRCKDYQADFEKFHPEYFRNQVEEYRGVPLPEGDSWESHFCSLAEVPGSQDKYGVNFLFDPAEPKPPLGPFFAMEYPYGVTFAGEERHEEMEAQNIKLMAFDLKRPLAPQIKKADRYLGLIQSELVGSPREQRNHRTKWARYLRVLDGKAADAKANHIARVLKLRPTDRAAGFDPERLVSETLGQARALQVRFKQIS